MLTETEKQQVRLYLGYPSAWRFKHSRLESLFEGTTPEAEIQVQSALASLALVEARILTVVLASAGLKKLDEMEWFASSGPRLELQALGKQYVSRISIVMGVPIYSNVFGRGGYLGDSFTPGLGSAGGSGGRGGPIRLG